MQNIYYNAMFLFSLLSHLPGSFQKLTFVDALSNFLVVGIRFGCIRTAGFETDCGTGTGTDEGR